MRLCAALILLATLSTGKSWGELMHFDILTSRNVLMFKGCCKSSTCLCLFTWGLTLMSVRLVWNSQGLVFSAGNSNTLNMVRFILWAFSHWKAGTLNLFSYLTFIYYNMLFSLIQHIHKLMNCVQKLGMRTSLSTLYWMPQISHNN